MHPATGPRVAIRSTAGHTAGQKPGRLKLRGLVTLGRSSRGGIPRFQLLQDATDSERELNMNDSVMLLPTVAPAALVSALPGVDR